LHLHPDVLALSLWFYTSARSDDDDDDDDNNNNNKLYLYTAQKKQGVPY